MTHSKPLLHPRAERLVELFAHTLPHALLVAGEAGVGAGEVAEYIARQHDEHPLIVLPEADGKPDLVKGGISVDAVRQLSARVKTKHRRARVVVLQAGNTMTIPAQNALLKLLEEPGTNIHIIIVCQNLSAMLPTIVSRAQQLVLPRITRAQSEALLDTLQVTDATTRQQLLFIAEGLPELLRQLASSDAALAERAALLRDARTLLQGDSYERLLVAQRYSTKRAEALQLVDDAMTLLRFAAISKHSLDSRTTTSIETFLACYKAIRGNANIRLALLAAVL